MTIILNRMPLQFLSLFYFASILFNPTFVFGGNSAMHTMLIAQAVSSDVPSPQDPADTARNVIQQRQRDDYDKLLELGDPRHSDTTQLQERFVNTHKAFLETWDSEPNRRFADAAINRQVQQRLNKARSVYDETKIAKEFENTVDRLLRENEGIGAIEDKIKHLNDFLNENTIPPLPDNARPHRDRIEARRRFLRQVSERQKWEEVVNIVRESPERYSLNRDRVRKYLRDNPETKFRTEADALIRETEVAWDRHEYDRICDQLEKYQTIKVPKPSQLSALAQDVRNYRNRQDPTPRMKNDVNDWLEWYDRTVKANVVFVYVDRVELERRSYLDHRWDSWIMLRVRRRNLRTDESEHERTSAGVQKIPFKASLNGIPYDRNVNVDLEVVSRWGWTRGLPDRVISQSISIVSREVPLMHDGKPIGTLYIRVNEQPGMPEYTSSP